MAAKNTQKKGPSKTPRVPNLLRNMKPLLRKVEDSIGYFVGEARKARKLARALRAVGRKNGK